MASLPDLAARWRNDLAAWAIPERILAAVDESPWSMPPAVFARRADHHLAAPGGPTHERVLEALPYGGTVLDAGAGPGTASLAVAAARQARVIAVDLSEEMLEELEERAVRLGLAVTCVPGRWPDVADPEQHDLEQADPEQHDVEQVDPARPYCEHLHPEQAGPMRVHRGHPPPEGAGRGRAAREQLRCDVAVAKDVLYNVPELPEFLAALTRCAAGRVVVELTARHPLTPLNPLWERLHGLTRPDRPTSADVHAIAVAMGLRPRIEHWRRPSSRPYETFEQLVEVTRTRLCVPRGRAGEVAEALRELGTDPAHPTLPGTRERATATLWWPGGG